MFRKEVVGYGLHDILFQYTATIMKLHMQHLKHKLSNFTLTTPVAIIIAAIIIAVGLVGYGAVSSSGPKVVLEAFKGKAIGAEDYVEGVSKKVFVIEYSDTECPYCVSFYPALKQARDEYDSKVGFIYRTFPLTSIHPHAEKEAEALLCAGKQKGADGYNGMMKAMFDYKVANKTTELASDGITTLGTQLGLDTQALNACVQGGEMADTVAASTNDGIAAGVTGTPTTFVVVKERDGLKVVATMEGARPYSYVKQAIDQALAQ